MHTIWKNNVHQQCNVVLLVLFLVVAQIVTNPFDGGGGGTGGVVFVLGQPPQSGSTTHHYTVEDYAIIENVREDNVEGILKALNDGGDINVIGPGGQTPLMLAVLSGKLESVKILLEKGADVTIGERYVILETVFQFFCFMCACLIMSVMPTFRGSWRIK